MPSGTRTRSNSCHSCAWRGLAASNETPAGRQVRHQELRHAWDLGPLKLAQGSIITFYGTARDHDSLKGPNVGKSREIRLRIVSKEDASRQFDNARRELREERNRQARTLRDVAEEAGISVPYLSEVERGIKE